MRQLPVGTGCPPYDLSLPFDAEHHAVPRARFAHGVGSAQRAVRRRVLAGKRRKVVGHDAHGYFLANRNICVNVERTRTRELNGLFRRLLRSITRRERETCTQSNWRRKHTAQDVVEPKRSRLWLLSIQAIVGFWYTFYARLVKIEGRAQI
jgi:hypothetical protein